MNGKLHPLNHLDINYESNCTYKIGLRDKIKLNHLIDVVDITYIFNKERYSKFLVMSLKILE
jgi:hypothetical protein